MCTNRREFGLIGIGRGKDGRLDSEGPCRTCDRSTVVARRSGDNPAPTGGFIQEEHLVERSTQLERSRSLKTLELQDDGTVCTIAQDRRDLRRCEPDMVSNTCLGCLDLIR
jgi:hypothetical protein